MVNSNMMNAEDKTGTEDHSCGRIFTNLSFVMPVFYAQSQRKMFLLTICVSTFLWLICPHLPPGQNAVL